MNKLFTKIAALVIGMAMAVGVGVAVGASGKTAAQVNADTIDFTSSSSGGWSTTGGAQSGEKSGITLAVSNGAINGTQLRFYAKSTITISSTAGNITSVVFTATQGTWSEASSGTISGLTWSGSTTSLTAKVGTQIRATNVAITVSGDAPTLQSIGVSTAPKTSYTEGEYFDPTGLVISRTWSSGDPDTYAYSGHSSEFSFSPDTSTALTTNDDSVTITYGGKSCSQAITVSAAPTPSGGDYEKATSVSVGDTILLVYEADKYELNGISSTSTKYGLGKSYSSAPTGAYPLSVVAGSSEGTVSLKNGNNYLTWTAGNSLNVTTSQSANSSWTITISNGDATIKNANTTTRVIKWNSNSGQERFACYESGQKSIQIYKKVSSDPSVSIETTSTSVVWDGSNSQTISFTATTRNFSDEPENILYEWRSNKTGVIDVTNVGSDSTANLKVVGAGNADITCYALGLSGDEATSEGITITVTNETYSGVLTITTSGDILTGSDGEIEYTLTGNTHPMNTFDITSTDDDVISVNYNTSTGKFEYLAGDTPNATAIVTITLSSSVYTLESYQKTLSVKLVDSSAVSSVTTNAESGNVKFGDSELSFVATVHLVGGGDATGKQVTWSPVDTGVCTITASSDTLTGTVVPVNVGTTSVRVASVDDPTKYHDVTVTVSAPDSKTLNSITINKGEGYKHEYYDTATEVDLTSLSLTANYVNSNYPSYSENVDVANDASGVTWVLDKTNKLVKVSYTDNVIVVEDSFSITVVKEPTIKTIVSSSLGIADQAEATGPYTVDPFTLTFAKNGGSNAPKYYNNGSSVRMYNGNTLVINSSDKVKSIDSIVITVHDSKTDFELSTNTGGSYSGSGLEYEFTDTTEITFTVGSGQFRPVTIEISYTEVESADKDVESVTVTPSTISVESGKTTPLSVQVLPTDARDLSVTWKSDDETVATVDENGVVTGVAPGTATITATSNDQDTISDFATVTVTAGPIVDFTASSKIDDESGSQVYLGNAFFNLTVTSGAYRGYEGRGAQFSSSKTAVDVGLELTDIAVATQDLRVIVDASRNANGTATLGVKLGEADLLCDSEASVTLNSTSTEYEFIYSGSASSTVNLSNLVNVSLSNDGGAIYVKSIKVYSAASKSVIGDFVENSLRMETYDKGGTQGSTGGNGSCKVWWNDVLTTYNGLSDGQKALFSSEAQYSAARARLSEWARINGYSFDSSTGSLSEAAHISPLSLISQNDNAIAIVVIVSVVSLTAIGGYFFLRKKREQN